MDIRRTDCPPVRYAVEPVQSLTPVAGSRWLWVVLRLIVCALAAQQSRAQVAITEAMSWASTDCEGCVGCHPDFWELTNFGTNPVDLTGYLFSDQNADFPRAAWRLEGITIRPDESIVFVRAGRPDVPDAAGFRAWWGDANLPADLQVYFYSGHGFDELGDGIRLADPSTNIVDEVSFGETKRGRTFGYSPESGGFVQSELGACGTLQATQCGDIGSPGRASCGRVPLQIVQQPVGKTVDVGNTVTLTIRAVGLPRPRFQWYFNGEPIQHENATTSSVPRMVAFAGCGAAWVKRPVPPDLTLPSVQPGDAGEYFVEVFNGLEKLTSAVVRLMVNTESRPLSLECPPGVLCTESFDSTLNLVVANGQAATFSVLTRGYPMPTFQWSRSLNGRDFIEMAGETNRELVIPSAGFTEAGVYRVRAQNSQNSLDAAIILAVKPKPKLKVTEIMSDPCRLDGCDWWELTNIGDEPVDLCGYRWDDYPGFIGSGPAVEHSVVVPPGESIIFLEGRTPEFFREWWGERNLPGRIQFVSYTANSLQSEGDEITLWNPFATRESDWIDSVSISTAVFGASFWFAPNDFCSEFGVASVDGDCGSFRAANGCDIGSPGWTAWTPPSFTSIQRDGNNLRLEWRAQVGSTTLIEYNDELRFPDNTSAWTELERVVSLGGGTVLATPAANASQRFYRLRTVATATCAACP